VPFEEGQPPRLLCAASDEGIFFADLGGRILRHLQLGHVQNPSTADYRPDLPGLETVTINFWGNQGRRNPSWNASNYQATVSRPGWSE
jgi:hypothetical protein